MDASDAALIAPPNAAVTIPRASTRPVDNMWMIFRVGAPQRREIKQRRGFQLGAFGYNEGPTSSCHTFCWKARHRFDVPFF
jgi:hypothetical protein